MPPPFSIVEFVGAMRAQQKVVVIEGQDHAEPAQFAASNDTCHFANVGVEGVGVTDYQRHPVRSCGIDHRIAIRQVSANGFSTRTCLPCSMAATACDAWN